MEKKMIEKKSPLRNENGSALIVVLLIMAATIVMGILATSSTVNELQIAGSDIQQKTAFFEADGATEWSAQLLEENIACTKFDADAETAGQRIIGDVKVEQLSFWVNEKKSASDPEETPDPIKTRALFFPSDAAADKPHTEVFLAGNSGYKKGSAMQLAAGYEGIGKGSAGSGVIINYDVIHDRYVNGKPASTVTIGWGHIVGQEEDCKY